GMADAHRMVELAPRDPIAQTQVAIMNHQFATFLVDSDPAKAAPYARRETEIYARLAAIHANDAEIPNALGSSYLMLGRIAANQGHLDEAARHVRKAVEIRESLHKQDPDHA